MLRLGGEATMALEQDREAAGCKLSLYGAAWCGQHVNRARRGGHKLYDGRVHVGDNGEVEEVANKRVPLVNERRVRVTASVTKKRTRGAGDVRARPVRGCVAFCWATTTQCRCC